VPSQRHPWISYALPLLLSPYSSACNSLINLKLSSSAVPSMLPLDFLFFTDSSKPTSFFSSSPVVEIVVMGLTSLPAVVGPLLALPLSLASAASLVELVLALRDEDSGVYRCSLGSWDECHNEVVGGDGGMLLAFWCSEAGGETREAAG